MAKVITFSRAFPSYHPNKGRETFFVEQLLNSLGIEYIEVAYLEELYRLNEKNIADGKLSKEKIHNFWLDVLDCRIKAEKHHTIRLGNRLEAGELFSPRVWSGIPYRSPQIIIAPDTEVKKVWRFQLTEGEYLLEGGRLDFSMLKEVAKNDGFNDSDDLELWFQSPMKGQIICWSDKVKY